MAQYSSEDRAAALAALKANAGNVKKTAREVGVPRKTLERWAKEQAARVEGATPPPGGSGQPWPPKKGVAATLLNTTVTTLADKCEAIANKAAGVVDAKLEDLTAQQAAVVLGIAIDKMRLLRDEATSISGTAGNLTDDDRLGRLRELAERARSRRLAVPDHDGAGTVGPPG